MTRVPVTCDTSAKLGRSSVRRSANGRGSPPGAVVGPVVTEFGCHLILVTRREQNRDQVEEKLARND